MTTKAELAERYDKASLVTCMDCGNVDTPEAFLAGYDACEERVLELLRSIEAMGYELDAGFRSGDFQLVAEWLERKLKGRVE